MNNGPGCEGSGVMNALIVAQVSRPARAGLDLEACTTRFPPSAEHSRGRMCHMKSAGWKTCNTIGRTWEFGGSP